MEWQGDLWGHVDEPLAEQQSHRLSGVVEDLLQIVCHTMGTTLLTLTQDQILYLLHTLDTLWTDQNTVTNTIFTRLP